MRGFLKQFAPDEFRPDEISILEDALDDAWRRVDQSKAPWASEDYSRAGRTILAKHIITMAKSGERDTKWLADSALLYLSQQKMTRLMRSVADYLKHALKCRTLAERITLSQDKRNLEEMAEAWEKMAALCQQDLVDAENGNRG